LSVKVELYKKKKDFKIYLVLCFFLGHNFALMTVALELHLFYKLYIRILNFKNLPFQVSGIEIS